MLFKPSSLCYLLPQPELTTPTYIYLLKIYILYKYLSTEKFQKQQEMSSKDHLWGFDSGVGTLFCSLGNIDSRPEWKKNMLNKAVTSCA